MVKETKTHALKPEFSSIPDPAQPPLRKCTHQQHFMSPKLNPQAQTHHLLILKKLVTDGKSDEVFSLATMTIIATGLETIWASRLVKKSTSIYIVRSELECAVSIRRRSRNKKIREQI